MVTSPLTDVVQHTYSCSLRAARSAAAVLTDLVSTRICTSEMVGYEQRHLQAGG